MKDFHTYTLLNGIRCIHYRTNSQVAYCAMTINAGSRDELKDELGMAHFAEHSLFKGTKNRKTHHINSRLEKLGGEINAFTTKEETVVCTVSLLGDLDKSAELIADVVFNSTFPQREIDREREVILDEINAYKDIPAERIYDEFEDLLFEDSALGHNILGIKRTVSKFNSSDVAAFTARCYNTDEMVFSVAADIGEKDFLRLINRHLSDKEKSAREFKREKPIQEVSFNKIIARNTYQGHCVMGVRAYNIHNPNRAPLSLLMNILGGPAANSMLNTLLREKNGLTYTIEASYIPYNDTGVAAIYFGSDKDKVERCIELIERQLSLLKTKPLTTFQLDLAKKQLIGQISISMDHKESYMLNVGKSYLIYNEVDSPEIVNTKIRSITAAEIMEVANEVLDDMSLLIYK